MNLAPKDKITFLEQARASDGYKLIEQCLTETARKEIEALINETDAVQVIRRQERIKTLQSVLRLPDVMINEELKKAK